MTQSKHTPGPWLRADAEEPDTEIIVSMGFTVATVWGGFADRAANARLIAAAPALLEALRDLLAHRHEQDPHYSLEQVEARARAAIQSATGEG